MSNKARFISLGLVFWAGCAGSSSHRDVPIAHPANPEAVEAPRVSVQSPFEDLPTFARPRQATPATSAPPMAHDARYTCPMHPDGLQNTPGTCPKCGMTLELEPPPVPHEHKP